MKIEISDNTPLLGSDSVLDSIGLVNVIIDIESKFADEGIEISLTSAEAMSRRNSPFRKVVALVDFITESCEEENV
jgi:acyl carrier protein